MASKHPLRAQANAHYKDSKRLYEQARAALARGDKTAAADFRRRAKAAAKQAKQFLNQSRETGEVDGIKENDFDKMSRRLELRVARLKKLGKSEAARVAKEQAAEYRAMAANMRKYGMPHAPSADPGAQDAAAAEEFRKRAAHLRADTSQADEAEERARHHVQAAKDAKEEAKKHRAEGRELSAKDAEERAKGHELNADDELKKAEHHRKHGRRKEAEDYEAKAAEHETKASTARASAKSGYADPDALEEERKQKLAQIAANKKKRSEQEAAGKTRKEFKKFKKEKARQEVEDRKKQRLEKRRERHRRVKAANKFRRQAIGTFVLEGEQAVSSAFRKHTIAVNKAMKDRAKLKEEKKKQKQQQAQEQQMAAKYGVAYTKHVLDAKKSEADIAKMRAHRKVQAQKLRKLQELRASAPASEHARLDAEIENTQSVIKDTSKAINDERKKHAASQKEVKAIQEKHDNRYREKFAHIFYKITGRKFPKKKLTPAQLIEEHTKARRQAYENMKRRRALKKQQRAHLKLLRKRLKTVAKGSPEEHALRDEIADTVSQIAESTSEINEQQKLIEESNASIEEIHEKEAQRLSNRMRAALDRWKEKYNDWKEKRAEKKAAKDKAKAKKRAARNEKIAAYTNKILGKFGFDLIPPDEVEKEAARHIEGGIAGWGTFALMASQGIKPPDPAEIVKQQSAKNGPPGQLHKGKKGGIFYYDHHGKKVYIDKMSIGKWKISHKGKIGKIYSMYKAFKAGLHGARLYH